MYGLLVVLGTAARKFSQTGLPGIWPAKSTSIVISPRPDIRVAYFTPKDVHAGTRFAWSDDRKVLVVVDGYFYTSAALREASLLGHAKAFANTCRNEGYEAGLRSIAGGTFNLVVVDLYRSRYHVTTDHIGSFPLYHSRIDGGWLLASNPVALANSGIIDTRPDFTAMAEWAYIGYTIGDRFMQRGIRIVAPYTTLHWNASKAEGHLEENPDSPWHILPEGPGPSPEEVNDAFEESCRRIATLEPRPVNLQSAGKDSRFILASWPGEYDPPCYTYGDVDSHEVTIARTVANQRGSRWIHVWLDGDEVAPDLPELFDMTGLITFPDRLLAARRIRHDGYEGILDGYLGGVFNGHGYLDCDRYFSLRSRLARYFTVFIDQSASRVGRDRIAEAILDSILEVRSDRELFRYVSRDFVERLRAERPEILEDLRGEVDRFMPGNNSLAALWNNLVLANRSAHAIVQQKVIVRAFVDVYCPFSGDVEFHRLQRRILPESAAYDRFYIRMYRSRHREYGKIPYGATLIPLTRPPLLHKWSAILLSKGLFIPFVTGNARRKERDANSWDKWLRQSRRMRNTALGFLAEGGILDDRSGPAEANAIARGAADGSGKLFHLASIAKWLALSGRVSA